MTCRRDLLSSMATGKHRWLSGNRGVVAIVRSANRSIKNWAASTLTAASTATPAGQDLRSIACQFPGRTARSTSSEMILRRITPTEAFGGP
ncbi:hypothetical protein [Novipirellula maiorica]|uniref:hypothetical protein n=1 Tax=Novipirellula maiorica TaxID=1265734 RepID=UPI00059383FB|nr:hypothetical protein [Rhodopirellula maiorica]